MNSVKSSTGIFSKPTVMIKKKKIGIRLECNGVYCLPAKNEKNFSFQTDFSIFG